MKRDFVDLRLFGLKLTVVTVLTILLVARSTAVSATLRTRHPESIPRGWTTYSYRKVKISVPSGWAIRHYNGCAVLSAPGTLNLGNPKQPSLCPAGSQDANMVSVQPLAPGDFLAGCPAISLNGLGVHVGPCGSSDPGGFVYYVIPSLGVQAVGKGTDNENVTGSGTGTVVGRVLHTLRR